MFKPYTLFLGFILFYFSYSQVNNNFKIELSDNQPLFFHSTSSLDSSVIKIANDTSFFVSVENNNLFYFQNNEMKYYLFLTNESIIELSFGDNNTNPILNGENSSFIIFLNEYYTLYKPQINKLFSENYLSDKFEVSLYNLLNKEVFNFYLNHKLYNDFSLTCKNYFNDFLKYEYLNTLSNYLIDKKNDSLQIFPFYRDVTIELLDWDIFKNSFLDTTYYQLEIFQNYIFNTLILFSLDYYKYSDQSDNKLQSFSIDVFNFSKNNLPHNLFLNFLTRYVYRFTPFLKEETINYLESLLMSAGVDKTQIGVLLEYYNLNYIKNIDSNQDNSVIQHEFYLENMEGKLMSLSYFRGKILYVDIWASWCGPCRKQFPYAKELKTKLSRKQLKKIKLIYISNDNDYDKLKESINKLNIKGDHFISPASKLNGAGNYFEISGIPRYILIDKNGNILDNNAKRPSDDTLLNDLLQLIN